MPIQRITSGILADGAIVATDIADSSITTAKIADANVTSSKLASTLSISGNFLANNVTANSNLIVPAGSAGAPSIFPSGDTNTGIFFPAADTIAFAEGGAEAMRIDSSGNVGIGTTLPGAKFAVFGSFAKSVDENTWGVKITDETAMAAGVGGGITFVGNYTTGGAKASFAAIAGAKTNSTTSNGLGELRLYTTDVSSNLTERARITSGGDFFIGTTTSFDGGLYKLEVGHGSRRGILTNSTGTSLQYAMIFQNGNGTVGSINTNGSATAYSTSSDYRLKHDIQPMTGALAKVQQLNPVTYKWNADDSAGEGFIAHELQEVCPDAVTGEKDAVDADGNPQYQGVDTSFLVATLTAAIQELKAINDAQASRIETLEAKVAALEANDV